MSVPVCRKEDRPSSLELLESEKQMCNLISKYSPQYVRSRALETPGDAFAVLVSWWSLLCHGCLGFLCVGTEDA